jgi:nitrogen-specific signal transduction histidine kinase
MSFLTKSSCRSIQVSKSLVLKHGGMLRFRSSQREGRRGTTFEVFLPKDELDPNHVSPTDG